MTSLFLGTHFLKSEIERKKSKLLFKWPLCTFESGPEVYLAPYTKLKHSKMNKAGSWPTWSKQPNKGKRGKEIAKTQLKNVVLLVEVFWDFKLKIFISLCSWRRLKFTLLVRIFAVFLRGRYPKLLELWQEGLDILGFNSLVERSVLLKSQALGMRRDSPLSKGNFECAAVSVNFCHTLSCLAGLLISVVPCTTLS